MWSFSHPEGVAEAALALATGPAIPASGSIPISAFLRLLCCGAALSRAWAQLLRAAVATPLAPTGFAAPFWVANFRLGAVQCS